ncbi:hypothetical protein DH2020_039164 [Rehmannia glutinosa]|uniref:Uncharacterized protein n=1 Tax=Rehmannia glutinosa TaxID=99300 RepID=A0ABR0UX34_REHGL
MDNGMHEKLLGSEGKEVGDFKGRVYDESKKIWRVALPGIIARVASFGTIIVTQSFIGHISSVDLAGYALVQTLTVRFANGVLWFLLNLDISWEVGALEAWTGFSTAAFKDLLPVIKLSISSGIMVCLELWYNSILVLLAGYMSNAEVAISAFSICLNINGWEFMICLGFLGAACVRIANELGRGDAKATKFSINVLITTSVVIGVFFTILCLVFGHNIGYLFTNDVEVASTVSDLSLLLAISVLLNSIYPVLSGVAVGAGMQGTVAIINLCCFYLIGIPIGALLGYVAHLEVSGIWIGMNLGILTQSLALSYMAYKTDWDEQVKIAAERLQRWYLKSSEEPGNNGHA